MLVNPVVRRSGGMDGELRPGDMMATSRIFSTIATVGAGVWTGAAIAGGILRRTGPTAAYIDTTDTAQNIMNALKGNAPSAISINGLSFELYVANTVAFAMTSLTMGRGVIAGTLGGTLNLAASSSKDYLFAIKNDTPEITVNVICNATTTALLALPPGMTSFKIGPAPDALMITPGMTITAVNGTAPAAGTVVTGLRYGQGGIIGFVSSAALAANITAITLSPTIEINNVGLD